MNFCNKHNLVDPERAGRECRFGIDVSLSANDTMRSLLGDDWKKTHWYASEEERDHAYHNMAVRHGYYRATDTPTQVLIKIVR